MIIDFFFGFSDRFFTRIKLFVPTQTIKRSQTKNSCNNVEYVLQKMFSFVFNNLNLFINKNKTKQQRSFITQCYTKKLTVNFNLCILFIPYTIGICFDFPLNVCSKTCFAFRYLLAWFWGLNTKNTIFLV